MNYYKRKKKVMSNLKKKDMKYVPMCTRKVLFIYILKYIIIHITML